MAKLTWNDLFYKGTLLSFSRHIWQARIKLTAKDLGYEKNEAVQRGISFGSYCLVPLDQFTAIDSVVNNWLRAIETQSLKFSLLDGVRFVPDQQIAALTEKLNESVVNFEQEVNEFMTRFTEMKEAQLPVIYAALNEVARDTNAAKIAFERIKKAYPTEGDVRFKFGLDWNLFTIQMPTSKEAANVAQDATNQIRSIVGDMVGQLRQELTDRINEVVQLAGDGKLNQKSVKATLKVLDRIDSMNIMNDMVLRQQSDVLRDILERRLDNKKAVALDDVLGSLSEAKQVLESSVEEAVADAEKQLTGLGQRKINL